MTATKKNPFFDYDFENMFGDMKLPMVDMEEFYDAQKKNMDAITAANQVTVECAQAVARRQADIMRQAIEDLTAASRKMMDEPKIQGKAGQQAELARKTFEKSIANTREMAEMISKSNQEAFELLNKRITECMDEMKDVIEKTGGASKSKKSG